MDSASIAGIRIMIVEDEAMITLLLQDMLEEMGCIIAATAAGLDEALAAAETTALDIAILDVNLGGTETYPVADVLRRRGIPYVFSTGYGASTLHADHQGRPTLQKPFVERDLLRCIGQGLGRTAA
ncbi:CheY-like chemotaxis protein [Stella humosa]|uniref:CheY-like chemotaxis protein n=1 Tax=Stella humosa TaxID=94 RepID=A0A3N1L083_9PROT|nr:response regulator [Stella humosa]ROP84439.1 CheY-like chemotaxis protein [Stella humosa]BBK33958.1 response regulator [Stella humosa]